MKPRLYIPTIVLVSLLLLDSLIIAKSKNKSVIIVRGGPGTGKSVIALNVLAELASKKIPVFHATGSSAFTNTLRKITRLLEIARQEDLVRPQSYLLEGFTLLWLMRLTYDNLKSRIPGSRNYEWIAYYEEYREHYTQFLAMPRGNAKTFANQIA